MKKIALVLLSLVIVISLFSGCSFESTDYVIGILNYVEDPSLNQIQNNIEAKLNELAGEKNVTVKIKIQNCYADPNIMNQSISNFISDNVDLMVGIATPVAIAMKAATEDNNIPVVFSAVSDPLSANLVDSLEKPGGNITGTSDFLNTEAILNMMLAANPGIKKVGLLYDNGQDSSKTPIETAKAFLKAHNIEYVEKNGKTVSEIEQAADSLVAEKVEAVFTPTDNSIQVAQLSIYEKFSKAKIPHYAGADSFALNGAFLGFGVDYEVLGQETAKIVAEILFEGKNPGEIPVKTFDNGIATINTEICEAIGFDFETISKAFEPFSTKIETIVVKEDFD